MGNQKEFIAQIGKLKKEFEFASEMAILINSDRLKHLEEIGELAMKVGKYERVLKDIAQQKTCAEQEADEETPIGSDGTRLGDIHMGYDCIIEEARKVLNIKPQTNGQNNNGTNKG